MACENWNDDWVASLYDELGPGERESLERHLEGCRACRETLDSLEASRRLLGALAPEVPAAPRVVVLQPRAGWRLAWAFAAGATAAALVLAVVFSRWPADTPPSRSVVSSGGHAQPATVRPDDLFGQLDQIELRLAQLEEDRRAASNADEVSPGQAGLTRAQMQRELRRFLDLYETERAVDFQYLIDTLADSEQRIDRNAQALTYLALRDSPSISEH